MPNPYAAAAGAGLLGGFILLGVLIYNIFKEKPHSDSGRPPPGGFKKNYDSAREDWGANDAGPGQRPGRPRGKAECGICKKSLANFELRPLPCLHIFHDKCITQWFRTSRTCPTCRDSMW